MKNPIKLFLSWLTRKWRKRQYNKRQEIYDEVITKLSPHIAEKRAKQQQLIKKLQANFVKDTGIQYGSKFLPVKLKNEMEAMHIINSKYGDEMRELDVRLNHELKFICI